MVIGAAWNGARAFTATSGPGISLMQEFIGLAYFAEIPAVIFDVQRGGPSTGMPTRTQQSDILICRLCLARRHQARAAVPRGPARVLRVRRAQAFDLADRLQTPVFVMLDLDIGMNEWLCEPFAWDDSRRIDRGKVLTAEELEAGREFGRYLDVDGDGIPYRTYPGTHPTARRLLHPRHVARPLRPLHRGGRRPTSTTCSGSCASSRPRSRSCRRRSAQDADAADPHRRDLFRLDRGGDGRGAGGARRRRASTSTRCASAPSRSPTRWSTSSLDHDQVFVVEQNRDAQLRTLLVNEGALDPARLIPILHYDGTPITARFIIDEIARHWRALTGAAPQGGRRMTYLAKPKLHHPKLPTNALGFTRRDYEGAVSTLCAGCGHDSISAAIIQACFELDCRRTASPSCPASAARRRRRPTSSARATASTACTAACRRC